MLAVARASPLEPFRRSGILVPLSPLAVEVRELADRCFELLQAVRATRRSG
jgi:hypothetical protein